MVNSNQSKTTRRTQTERSDAMRKKLITATLNCLITEGYSGTTISKIISTAKVSRGAPVHHFNSKAALIEAAADHLIRQFYISLGKMIGSIQTSDDRIYDLIMAGWRNILATPETTAMLELLVASRHEPELAAIMQKLWTISYKVTRSAAEHYFEPVTKNDNVGDIIILTQWLLRGMAEDRHINSGSADATAFFEHYLKLWANILANHLRAKTDVHTSPPKPDYWTYELTRI